MECRCLLQFAVEVIIIISPLSHLSQVQPCCFELADGQVHVAFIHGLLCATYGVHAWEYMVEEEVDLRSSHSSYKSNN